MGIDPSLTSTGYAVLFAQGGQAHPVEFGTIKTRASQPLAHRLERIYRQISRLISKHGPDEFAVEEVFYARNPKAALMLGYARGAALLAAATAGVPVSEYSAREIKLAVTGYGNASKEQVRRMVRSQVASLPEDIGFDVSDAFAVALCHLHRQKQMSRA